jgi:hypothetical protein
MLLASVPALHDARDREHWRQAARETGRCTYHERLPEGDAEAPETVDNPTMAEIEPGHLVTCVHVDEEAAVAALGRSTRCDTVPPARRARTRRSDHA